MAVVSFMAPVVRGRSRSRGTASDSLSAGACSCRRTGVHFAGTCASLSLRAQRRNRGSADGVYGCRLGRPDATQGSAPWPSTDRNPASASNQRPVRPRRAARQPTTTPASRRSASTDAPPTDAMAAYFKKCEEKLGFVPNVLKAYAFDMAQARGVRRHVQRPHAGAVRALQARARDDRGRGVVGEPLLLLPHRPRRRGARARPAIRCWAS